MSLIGAGRVLIKTKNELENWQCADRVVNDLRFGSRKEGSRKADLRKAEMLIFLARNDFKCVSLARISAVS
jgi:hypothetical protein